MLLAWPRLIPLLLFVLEMLQLGSLEFAFCVQHSCSSVKFFGRKKGESLKICRVTKSVAYFQAIKLEQIFPSWLFAFISRLFRWCISLRFLSASFGICFCCISVSPHYPPDGFSSPSILCPNKLCANKVCVSGCVSGCVWPAQFLPIKSILTFMAQRGRLFFLHLPIVGPTTLTSPSAHLKKWEKEQNITKIKPSIQGLSVGFSFLFVLILYIFLFYWVLFCNYTTLSIVFGKENIFIEIYALIDIYRSFFNR